MESAIINASTVDSTVALAAAGDEVTEPGDGATYVNPLYQRASVGGSPDWPVDFLMWFEDDPWVDIELYQEDESSGEIHQASCGVTQRYTIGTYRIEGPEGATGASISAEPSVEVESPFSGKPVGRFSVNFTAGDLPGRYVVTFELSAIPVQMVVDVTE